MTDYRFLSAVEFDDTVSSCFRFCSNGRFVFLELKDVSVINEEALKRLARRLLRTPEGKADWTDYRAVATSRPLVKQWLEGLDITYRLLGTSLFVAVDFTQWD